MGPSHGPGRLLTISTCVSLGFRPLPSAPFVRRPHRDSKTVGRKARNSAGRQAKRRNGIHGKRVCHGTKVVQVWEFCMGLGCSRSGTAAWIGGPRIHCGYHASGYVHMYSPHSFTSGHGAMGMTHVHDDGILPPRAVQVVLKVKTSTTWMWHYMRVGQVRLSSAGSQVKRLWTCAW